MYTHLALLGIDHVDIRYANILQAPESPPGWPSLVSPHSHAPYRWRLVDFERSRKTNRNLEKSIFHAKGWLSRVLDNLPFGDIVEPWEF